MLYLAIDQHRKQLTVNLRDEDAQVLVQRQVSTRWQAVREFFSTSSYTTSQTPSPRLWNQPQNWAWRCSRSI